MNAPGGSPDGAGRATPEATPEQRKSGTGFRADIQGIRGVAVTLVLLCHAGIPFAPGGYIGVDVFYVLSGFLITGLIAKEIDRRSTLSIRGFYARRAKRLLPLAATVLAFTGVASLFVYGKVNQVIVGGDIFASALYYVNWHFINVDVDYFAGANGLISPVQHYWSLSVEEQFYLVWPVLMLGIGLLAIRLRRHLNSMIVAVFVPIVIASLVYSITLSETNGEDAFFSTLTRVWELGFGAILALTLPRIRQVPLRTAQILGVSGLIAIAVATILYTGEVAYPGWRALVPVLGTVALLVAGVSAERSVATRFLSTRPLQYLGDISYAWYLWHWPFIILAAEMWGPLSVWWLIVIVLVSWIPTAISHRYIEEPFRRSKQLKIRPGRALALGAACTAIAAVVGLGLQIDDLGITVPPQDQVAGAGAIVNGKVPIQQSATELRPNPLYARSDRGQAYTDGCLVQGLTIFSGECTYGDEDSDKTVVLFGDSHALQYFPAVEEIARSRGWKLVIYSRGDCVIADVEYRDKCDEWRADALSRIEDLSPQLVIVAASSTVKNPQEIDGKEISRKDSEGNFEEGAARLLERLETTGARVVLIRDQILPPFTPHFCVAEHINDLGQCTFERKRRNRLAYDVAAARAAGIKIIDPVPKLCTPTVCPSVIGNVVVYRDENHITATYMKTMAPWLDSKLFPPKKPADSSPPDNQSVAISP